MTAGPGRFPGWLRGEVRVAADAGFSAQAAGRALALRLTKAGASRVQDAEGLVTFGVRNWLANTSALAGSRGGQVRVRQQGAEAVAAYALDVRPLLWSTVALVLAVIPYALLTRASVAEALSNMALFALPLPLGWAWSTVLLRRLVRGALAEAGSVRRDQVSGG